VRQASRITATLHDRMTGILGGQLALVSPKAANPHQRDAAEGALPGISVARFGTGVGERVPSAASPRQGCTDAGGGGAYAPGRRPGRSPITFPPRRRLLG
jgi:hypothetical protein